MTAWEELHKLITDGNIPAVLPLLKSLDEAGRKEIAHELPAFVRSGAERGWDDGRILALKAAGAACLPSAAAAASWLTRRDLRAWRNGEGIAEAVLRAAAHRPDAWRADVGRRVAARLRLSDMDTWTGGQGTWEIAARLLVSAGEPPPTGDAFVVGWLTWRRTTPPAEDPFFPALVPALFEAEGAGARLARDQPRTTAPQPRREGAGEQSRAAIAQPERGEAGTGADEQFRAAAAQPGGGGAGARLGDEQSRAAIAQPERGEAGTGADEQSHVAVARPGGGGAGARLAGEQSRAAIAQPGGAGAGMGRSSQVSWLDKLVAEVDRGMLLDGCVRRFLRGGRARDLGWFVRLHDALEPTAAESVTRLRDYVRLLPTAPTAVAELAFAQVKAADAETRLSGELLTEAAGAVLFRPERKLVKAMLIWLDKTARSRGRESETVALAATAFGNEHPELRERAVRLAVKHAAKADPLAAETVREAAGTLPATLLRQITEAFGAVEAIEPEALPVLYAPVPTDLPAPIGSPAELLEETAVWLRSADMGWAETERLLAGLVAFGPGAAGELERLVMSSNPYLLRKDLTDHLQDLEVVVNALLLRRPRRALVDYLKELRSRHGRRSERHAGPGPARLLYQRFVDAAAHLGTPVLLATPTSSTGHLDPDVFAARLRLLEESGTEPGRYDFEQALLRLPSDTVRVPGLEGLVSPAALEARAWLAEGGLATPELTYGFAELARRNPDPGASGPRYVKVRRFHAESTCESSLRSARLLGTLAPPERADLGRPWPTEFWPSMLPSHREVIAAHILGQAAFWPSVAYDQGAPLLALSDATGPTGPATAAVLLYGLGSGTPAQRTAAVDALLSFAAQDSLPAADLGRLLPSLLETGGFPLTRLLPPLTEAIRAGAPLWPFFAEAIPALLPSPGTPTRSGLTPFLSLATATAELHHIHTPLPTLTTWTPPSPSSRLAKETTRLHQALTPT